MNHFHTDWKRRLEMIRYKASVEIAVMLIVSILCCVAADRYPNTWPWASDVVSKNEEGEAVHDVSVINGADTANDNDSLTDLKNEINAMEEITAAKETSALTAASEMETAPQGTDALEMETAPEEEALLTEAELMAQASPSPTRLNMAYEFPNLPGDPSNSYAGNAYYDLIARDEQWVSQMYANRETAPGILAVSLGLTGRNIGNYSEWTNVGLLFYDGDGNMISGYSNAREILAMASVYSYFHPFDSIEEFYQYAEALWKASHKYSISVSDVYFCEGECKYEDSHIDEDDSGAAWSDPEGIAPAETSAGGERSQTANASASAASSGSRKIQIGPLAPLNPQTSASRETSSSGTESVQESAPAETASAPDTTTVPETAVPETAASETISPETTVSTSPETTVLEESTVPSETTAAATAVGPLSVPSGIQPETTAVSETIAETTVNPEAEAVSSDTPETQKSVSDISAAPESVGGGPLSGPLSPMTTAETAASSEPAPENPAPASEKTFPAVETQDHTEVFSESSGAAQRLPSAPQSESSSTTETVSENKCNGHVDLTIHATIIGFKEMQKNLYTIDKRSNSEEDFTDAWKGWSMLRKRYVQALLEQDWYDLYGLTVPTSLYIQNPLTAAEIRYYMTMLPEDTSEDRRKLIELALQSVGCIPYYWGGKPYGPGYETNGFGNLISPDENGRSLRGLDCSGWISWLYWTALGRHLPYESTSGLYALGRQVDRSELKPGDYIVRTGDDAHVCLFLAWAPDGTMYVIHERGSSSNNVIVSNFDLYWPYYRNLLD